MRISEEQQNNQQFSCQPQDGNCPPIFDGWAGQNLSQQQRDLIQQQMAFQQKGTQTSTESISYKGSTVPATSNGNSQPPQYIKNAVIKAFGDLGEETVNKALMVARCESSFRPEAHLTELPKSRLSGDRGLFQMNHTNDAKLGVNNPADLFNAEYNAQKARLLYEKAGRKWRDWGTPTSSWGTYKCHKLT